MSDRALRIYGEIAERLRSRFGPPEPSGVERLAALVDPEMAKRVAAWDNRAALHDHYWGRMTVSADL